MWNKSDTLAPIKSQNIRIKYEKRQDMGDGEIEFLSFTDNFRFGLFERLLTGGGKRVAQGRLYLTIGSGPFLISFIQSTDPVIKPIVTYAQIDGEYMQIVNPLFMKICRSTDLPRGKINAVFKNKQTKPKNIDTSKPLKQ